VRNSKVLAQIFSALAAEPRVRIVQLLGKQTLCVGELARRLGMTQAAVSQHLRVLRQVGLVAAEKRGSFVHYSLDRRAAAAWKRAAQELLTPAPREQPCAKRQCR